MGDDYFLRRNFHRDFKKKPVESLIRSSEDVSIYDMAGEDVIRFVDGNLGIFFYEADLWDKKKLKRDLLKIIDAIDTIPTPPQMVSGL
jgi:uncharacterized protein (DUF2164 family)